jgi:hypothetical protein
MCEKPNHERKAMSAVTLDQIETPTDERYVVRCSKTSEIEMVAEWDVEADNWKYAGSGLRIPDTHRWVVLGPVSSLSTFTLPEKDDTPPKPDLSDWPGWEAVEYRKANRGEVIPDQFGTPHICESGTSVLEHWILRQVQPKAHTEPTIPPKAEREANRVGWTIERMATKAEKDTRMMYVTWECGMLPPRWAASICNPYDAITDAKCGDVYICKPITTDPSKKDD